MLQKKLLHVHILATNIYTTKKSTFLNSRIRKSSLYGFHNERRPLYVIQKEVIKIFLLHNQADKKNVLFFKFNLCILNQEVHDKNEIKTTCHGSFIINRQHLKTLDHYLFSSNPKTGKTIITHKNEDNLCVKNDHSWPPCWLQRGLRN